MGRVRRHFDREHSLHVWPAALELLLVAKLASAPDVRVDLRDRSFFRRSLQKIGNLWIVAVIHGIGNAYIVAGLSSAR
jgi:hypothetical protein